MMILASVVLSSVGEVFRSEVPSNRGFAVVNRALDAVRL